MVCDSLIYSREFIKSASVASHPIIQAGRAESRSLCQTLEHMRPFSSTRFNTILCIAFLGVSAYLSHVESDWVIFQRSGSMVTLLGAVMSVRSYFRLGQSGVGGAKPIFVKATLQSYDSETNLVKVSYDEETKKAFQQSLIDDIAFSIGMFFVVVGSVVQGYGDLLKYVF